MAGDEVQVEPQDLTGKAAQIRGLSWSAAAAQPALISPDALIISSVAITNLSVNADGIWALQEYGRVEGQRLAQTLDNVAAAYAEVDRLSAEAIGATMDVPGGGTVMPRGVDIPPLPHPPAMPIPKGQLPPDPMLDPVQTQQALDAGDDAESLRAAAQMWRSNATSLETSAQQFETSSLLWEGEAADSAYAKFTGYRDWLVGLAGSWKRLAGEADRLATAHDTAKADHRPIADEYRRLYEETMGKPLDASVLAAMERMAELQGQSEELRNTYAREGQPYQVEPEDPPSPVVSGVPVTVDDHRRARKPLPEERSDGQPGGGQGGAPAGGQQSGGTPQMPREAPASPMAATEPAAQAAQQGAPQGHQGGSPGGSQGGGSQGGGSQGGGSPSGGSQGGAPGGMPAGSKGDAIKPLADPSLKPAAAGGGGSGGGGGGLPSSPLQPAVGAETVAPTPALPTPVAPAAAAGPGSGGAAGGMGGGGMAPMMHGAQGGAGEKKRNPQLSPDEPLYVEDRPHTEQVIGVRPRRRGSPDDKGRGETQ